MSRLSSRQENVGVVGFRNGRMVASSKGPVNKRPNRKICDTKEWTALMSSQMPFVGKRRLPDAERINCKRPSRVACTTSERHPTGHLQSHHRPSATVLADAFLNTTLAAKRLDALQEEHSSSLRRILCLRSEPWDVVVRITGSTPRLRSQRRLMKVRIHLCSNLPSADPYRSGGRCAESVVLRCSKTHLCCQSSKQVDWIYWTTGSDSRELRDPRYKGLSGHHSSHSTTDGLRAYEHQRQTAIGASYDMTGSVASSTSLSCTRHRTWKQIWGDRRMRKPELTDNEVFVSA